MCRLWSTYVRWLKELNTHALMCSCEKCKKILCNASTREFFGFSLSLLNGIIITSVGSLSRRSRLVEKPRYFYNNVRGELCNACLHSRFVKNSTMTKKMWYLMMMTISKLLHTALFHLIKYWELWVTQKKIFSKNCCF